MHFTKHQCDQNFFISGSPSIRSSILMCKSAFYKSFQTLKTVGKSFKSPWKDLDFCTNLPVWTLHFTKHQCDQNIFIAQNTALFISFQTWKSLKSPWKVLEFCTNLPVWTLHFTKHQCDHKISLFQGAPPSDAPAVDTQEQVYISSLALLKVNTISW